MLGINEVTYRIGGRTLLDHATVTLPANSRVGLVGRNGAGKTTLFRIITGEITPELGEVKLPPRARIGRLAQEAPDGPEHLIEVVLAADRERTQLLAEAETEREPSRIAEIQTRLADIGAYSAPARAAEILAGLGFSHAEQQRSCQEFSGGWRMRVALAAALFAEPDLLLLDEPTNYLDLEATLWLEQHIARYPYSVIVISHDRDLLDNAVDWTLHLAAGSSRSIGAATASSSGRAASARRSTSSSPRNRRPSAKGSPPSSSGSAPRPPRRARRNRASSSSPSSSRSPLWSPRRCGRS